MHVARGTLAVLQSINQSIKVPGGVICWHELMTITLWQRGRGEGRERGWPGGGGLAGDQPQTNDESSAVLCCAATPPDSPEHPQQCDSEGNQLLLRERNAEGQAHHVALQAKVTPNNHVEEQVASVWVRYCLKAQVVNLCGATDTVWGCHTQRARVANGC